MAILDGTGCYRRPSRIEVQAGLRGHKGEAGSQNPSSERPCLVKQLPGTEEVGERHKPAWDVCCRVIRELEARRCQTVRREGV